MANNPIKFGVNVTHGLVSPCKNCERRSFKCHSYCNDFMQYEERCRSARKDNLQKMKITQIICDSIQSNRNSSKIPYGANLLPSKTRG